jgi:hypothetical protein
MKYKVTKDEQEFEVEDTVLFDDQPKAFKKAFNELKQGDTAGFDNCATTLMPSGRILITEKTEDNGTI